MTGSRKAKAANQANAAKARVVSHTIHDVATLTGDLAKTKENLAVAVDYVSKLADSLAVERVKTVKLDGTLTRWKKRAAELSCQLADSKATAKKWYKELRAACQA